jgi:hypothetical protein
MIALVVVAVLGSTFDTLRGSLEWVVLVVSALAAVGVAYRFLSRITRALEELVRLVTGDSDTPGLSARLEGLEREVLRFREQTRAITDLARDESVEDVRSLLRRGRLP